MTDEHCRSVTPILDLVRVGFVIACATLSCMGVGEWARRLQDGLSSRRRELSLLASHEGTELPLGRVSVGPTGWREWHWAGEMCPPHPSARGPLIQLTGTPRSAGPFLDLDPDSRHTK